jgi:hypothetical protein
MAFSKAREWSPEAYALGSEGSERRKNAADGLFEHPARAVPGLLRKAALCVPLVTDGLAASHFLA